MKKIYILSALFVGLSFATAVAQNTATVNINLTAVQSIKVDAGSNVVEIDIETPDDYINGKAGTAIANHLQASSTQLFTISAQASGAFLKGGVASIDDIPLSALSITPAFGSSATLPLSGQVYTPLLNTVSTSAQPIIKASSGSTDAKFSVTYGISAGTGGANLINRPEATYTTTITYTIAAN